MAVLSAPSLIAAVALVLRLVNIIADRTYVTPAATRTWSFAYEVGGIAQWLFAGHGFSSPYFSRAPVPTAWVSPIYPLLLAGVFKLFGPLTDTSAFVMLALSALFSALTCVVVFAIAERMFGRAVAICSAWAWALLPNTIYWSTHWIYYTSLSALTLSLAFLLTLRLEENRQLWKSFAFGLFWALNVLINAAVGAFLPVSLAWLVYRLRHEPRRALAIFTVACLGFGAGMAPWVIRNYSVFGQIVLTRSDFPEELWAGNHPGGTGLNWNMRPWNAARLHELGELGYMAQRRREALQFIRQNPGQFAIFTLRRIGFFWCDIPEPAAPIGGYPRFIGRIVLGTNTRHALYFGFALLAFLGSWRAYRRRVKGAVLFAGLFLFFPLVYYITLCHPRYQFPILPEMLVVAVYALYSSWGQPSTLAAWWTRKRGQFGQAAGQ